MIRLIFLFILLLPSLCFGANWYCRPQADAPYGDGSGTSYENAWGGLIAINQTSIQPGDTLHLYGTFNEGELVLTLDGNDDNYIKIIGHDSAIIDVRTIITDTWTQIGTNLWELSTSGYHYQDPRRLWVDGTEGLKVSSTDDLTINNRWLYDSGSTSVILYLDHNPKESTIIGNLSNNNVLLIAGGNYLKFNNISFYGGYRASVQIRGSGDLNSSFIEISDCSFSNGFGGLVINDTGTTTPDNIKITNCIFDSNYKLTPYNNGIQSFDGIQIAYGATNIIIDHNIFRNWTHSALGIDAYNPDPYYGVDNILFQYNNISCPDINYGRGIGISATLNKSNNVSITNNVFDNIKTQNQINASNITFAYNVTMNIHKAQRSITDVGLVLSEWTYNGNELYCQNNKIVNNTFINIYNPAISIRLSDTSLTHGPSNNTIANNIIFNCGDNDNADYKYGLMVYNEPKIINNTFNSNLIFNENRGINGEEIFYRGSHLTVSGWNTADSDGDVIENNIQSNPLLINYHIQQTSPARRVGIWIDTVHDSQIDIDGDLIKNPPDIGADQFYSQQYRMMQLDYIDPVFYNHPEDKDRLKSYNELIFKPGTTK